MNRNDAETIVRMADEFDAKGLGKEAAALDAILEKVALEGMSGKASKALNSLHKACESFCKKNLDSRGENRRTLNKICDMCEDLRDECAKLMGT